MPADLYPMDANITEETWHEGVMFCSSALVSFFFLFF